MGKRRIPYWELGRKAETCLEDLAIDTKIILQEWNCTRKVTFKSVRIFALITGHMYAWRLIMFRSLATSSAALDVPYLL